MGVATGTRAREYLRVSRDRSGRERSNTEQSDDNRASWPDLIFGEPYRDATSASRYATKTRDDFAGLLADLAAGRFDADVLVLWEGSRGSRRTGEWVTLIELCEEQHVHIAVTEDERVYDPANPRDRKSLLETAIDAEYESAKISGRVRRSTAASARNGRPHGRVLYGYRRVYDPDSGAMVGQRPDEDGIPPVVAVLCGVFGPVPSGLSPADVVRRVFTEYRGGSGFETIAEGLNADGSSRRDGKPWTLIRIRDMIVTESYAGRRVHRGKHVGAADWPALIDTETFDAVQARRQALAEMHLRQGATVRLLTGVARCGRCGAKMFAGHSKTRVDLYHCRGCKRVSRNLERLDAWVVLSLLERLDRPDAAVLFTRGPDPEVTEAETRLVELKAELAEVMGLWKQHRLTAGAYADMEAHLLPQITEAERVVRRTPVDVGDLPAPGGAEAWWEARSPERQRAAVCAFIVAVTVDPVGRGRRTYDYADHTRIEWRRVRA